MEMQSSIPVSEESPERRQSRLSLNNGLYRHQAVEYGQRHVGGPLLLRPSRSVAVISVAISIMLLVPVWWIMNARINHKSVEQIHEVLGPAKVILLTHEPDVARIHVLVSIPRSVLEILSVGELINLSLIDSQGSRVLVVGRLSNISSRENYEGLCSKSSALVQLGRTSHSAMDLEVIVFRASMKNTLLVDRGLNVAAVGLPTNGRTLMQQLFDTDR
jgi:hypothetical protein